MNSHDKYAALLDAFLDGELSEAEAEEVRVHLSQCADCQAYISDALAIRDAFPDIEETVVPDGFAESVLAALPPRPISWRTQWKKIALPLAACAALVILLHGIADNIPTRGGASMSSGTEAAVTTDMDTGGGMPLLGNTVLADDADTVPPQAPELYDAAEAQSAEKNAPDLIPFAMRSSETEVPEEAEEESISNGSAASGASPAAAKQVPDEYAISDGGAATAEVPDGYAITSNKNALTEESPDGYAATKTVSDKNTLTEESPDEYTVTETVSDKNTLTEESPDKYTVTETVSDKNTLTEESPDEDAAPETFPDGDSLPAPEPTLTAVLTGESQPEPERPESAPEDTTADLSSGVWTLPAEARALLDGYAPAEMTESGIWYALAPEEFDALSRNLAGMELKLVPGADAPPPTARPNVQYVFVPL